MAKNLLDLAASMEKLAKSVEVANSELAVKVADKLVRDLIYITPVDTSRALSNWLVTLGRPAGSGIAPYFFGQKGSTQMQSAAEAYEVAKMVLKAKKPGQTIFITNNTPYIRELNAGSSMQTPAGFVERAVLIARNSIASYRIGK